MNKSILKIFTFIFAIIIFLPFGNLIAQSENYPDIKSGINLENLDPTVDPNGDFYQYSNGTWLKNNPVPPEYSRYGSWEQVIEGNNKVLKAILENAAYEIEPSKGSKFQKIGDLYFTAMDTVKIEEDGMKPLKEDLERINKIETIEDFQEVLAYLRNYWISPLFSFWAGQDSKNSENVIPQLYQGGLGLPDRDYYLKTDEKSNKLREQYVEHIAKMFELMGYEKTNAEKSAEKIIKIETRLAEASMTRVERRDPDATYHLMTLKELSELTPDFSWKTIFDGVGLTEDYYFENGINVGQPDFFKEINVLMTDTEVSDLKDYLKWNMVRRNAYLLSSEFENEDFRFYNKVLRGTEKMQPRWKRSLRLINRTIGQLLGQFFVKERFKPEAKENALEMVDNILETFRERIMKLDWMGDETKVEALKKLDKFTVKIGYPDEWIDYSSLDIDRGSFFENVKRARNFSFKRVMDRIGKPVNRKEWFMNPQTVNAYYSSSKNEIVFPAGILQPPFFNAEVDDALNYGGIGTVIGHEITHGFDDQGRKFDAEGNRKDWWTKEDEERFKVRADKLVEQYNNYIAVDSLTVSGELTLGENIADLGGLTVSFAAFKKTLEGKPEELIDTFTPEQRFFLSFSQIWKSNIRPEELKLRLITDPHSPAVFRVIGPLSNMIEFKEAFDGKDGDPMIRNEEERVVIW
ncbi:MAG: M13 family metallopeptidase [Ignavibacteria bacterium]|nr:M13 family metallopeptidase [Ignavibacteria bacterium]